MLFLHDSSAEDVEKLKQQDIFEQLMEEMLVEFPHMTKVLVSERDTFISGYLQKVMKSPVFLLGHGELVIYFNSFYVVM